MSPERVQELLATAYEEGYDIFEDSEFLASFLIWASDNDRNLTPIETLREFIAEHP